MTLRPAIGVWHQVSCAARICALASVLVCEQASSVEFEVQGTLTHEFFGTAGGLVVPYTNLARFRVSVRDCAWLIRSTNSRPGSIEFFEAGLLEESAVMTMSFESGATRAKAREGRSAKINGIAVPRFAEADELAVLWFVYASGCYLDEQRRQPVRIEEVNAFGAPDGGQPQKSRLVEVLLHRAEQAPQLPMWCVWLGPDGSTNAVFHAQHKMTVGGLELPTTWRYDVLAAQPNERRPLHSYTVDDIHIEPRVSQDPNPTLAGAPLLTMVEDYRFAGDNPTAPVVVRYILTNRWLSREELQRTKTFSDAALIALHESKNQRTHSSPSWLVRAAVLGIASLSFALVVFLALRKNNKNAGIL